MKETFQPRSNFVWAGVSFSLISLFAINSYLVSTNSVQFGIELVICVVLAGITYLMWIKPKLVLKDDLIEVINPISTEFISYRDILGFETKWALKIIHSGGKTIVWVAPASGKRRWIGDKTFGWYGSNVPFSETGHVETETMSESLNSFSGQAAYMIRERMKRLH